MGFVQVGSNMAAMFFAVPFKYAAMVALIGFSLAALSDGCTFQSDCEANQVCCHSECVYSSSCVGQYCSYDSDCSDGESCCGQTYKTCVSSSTCVGQYCSSDSDCSIGESCCELTCVSSSSCVGQHCSLDSDCGSWETCCHGTCQYDYDNCVDIAAVVIASSVIGSLAFVCMISMCFFYARRRGRSIQGGVIVGQRVTASTTTTTRYATQGNPPYQGQAPPYYSYQQCHPYYPVTQSEQHQTANPPPYNPGTMAGSEQPPPYPTEPNRASGGVHAPINSYGTIPRAPAV